VQATGVELFSATGWLEPGPTPIEVGALAEGVVESLHVLPGQRVEKGQVVAKLIDADARLSHAAAVEEQAERRLKVKSAEADVAEATAQFRVAEVAARAEAELYQTRASGRVRYDQALAQVEAARARVDQAKARLEEAKTRIRQGEVAVQIALLRLERMTVRAPVAGFVMMLNTAPGRMLGFRVAVAGQADSIVTLYDPDRLQVRVEVPIDKFQLVRPGQPAAVELDVVPGERLGGIVLYDTHETDINRNTVRVKVGLQRPSPLTFIHTSPMPSPALLALQGICDGTHLVFEERFGPLRRLRPGMIAKVRIIAPPSDKQETGGEVLRLWIPKKLLVKEDGKSQVWVVQQQRGRAQLSEVTLGTGQQGELIEVTQGLQPSDKLIVSGRESLKPGERVRIAGEE
jgi:multidrug efflux pump subunit AcrA (membrane-fusion protein)